MEIKFNGRFYPPPKLHTRLGQAEGSHMYHQFFKSYINEIHKSSWLYSIRISSAIRPIRKIVIRFLGFPIFVLRNLWN